MMHKAEIIKVLKNYNVDSERGFLPRVDPSTTLPPIYKEWDDLGTHFSEYLNAGIIRERILEMPLITQLTFEHQGQMERAMLLLSMFAHAYVNAYSKKMDHIPICISKPWVEISNLLGRRPVLSHASLVLQNWRKLDPKKPIQLDNLATIIKFHGGLDESWFYLVTVQIERVGGPAIVILMNAIKFLEKHQFDQAIECLNKASQILKNMTETLLQMYIHCDPPVFYKRIRPFLDSFVDVDYKGTNLGKQSFHGGSAAQSSLIQFFDSILGNRYHDLPNTNHYLLEMRKHMPPKHAAFLQFLESKPSIKSYSDLDSNLKTAYQNIMDRLIEFRNEHLKMVSIYIMKQAKAENAEAKGTGGTNPLLFLKSIRNKNKS